MALMDLLTNLVQHTKNIDIVKKDVIDDTPYTPYYEKRNRASKNSHKSIGNKQSALDALDALPENVRNENELEKVCTAPPKNALLETDPKNKISNYKQITQPHKKETTEEPKKYRIEYSNGQLHDPRPTYKKVGAYESEEHLLEELAQYPRLAPCPKMDWRWQDKERCHELCTAPPKKCIYFHIAKYEVQYAYQ